MHITVRFKISTTILIQIESRIDYNNFNGPITSSNSHFRFRLGRHESIKKIFSMMMIVRENGKVKQFYAFKKKRHIIRERERVKQ